MRVRELMSRPVHTVQPHDSLARAAALMWEHDCGVVPVVDHQGRTGAAITDRDICMAAYTQGRPLDQLRVADAMSGSIVTCRPDDDLATAAAAMAEHQVRRLPVVDDQGNLCGMLSLNDVVIEAAGHHELDPKVLQVLAGVCRHRTAVPAASAPQRPLEPAAPARSAAAAGAQPASAPQGKPPAGKPRARGQKGKAQRGKQARGGA